MGQEDLISKFPKEVITALFKAVLFQEKRIKELKSKSSIIKSNHRISIQILTLLFMNDLSGNRYGCQENQLLAEIKENPKIIKKTLTALISSGLVISKENHQGTSFFLSVNGDIFIKDFLEIVTNDAVGRFE